MKLLRKSDVLTVLQELSLYSELKFVRIGLFGSYSRDEQNEDSDIDIVYSLKNSGLNSLNEIPFFIQGKLCQYDNEFDVIWLELLEEDDKKMDDYLLREGLGINECSPYKELLRDVIWVN